MALVDSFNQVAFATIWNIDKVAYEGTAQYSKTTGSTGSQSITNPLGYKCFITLAWSIDNVNFYPALAYTQASAPATVNACVSDSTITFYLDNFSGSTQTFYIKYVLDTID